MSKLNAKERGFYDLVVELALVVNTMLVSNYHFPSKQEVEKHTKLEVGDLVIEVSTLNNKRFNLGRLGYFVKQEGNRTTIRRLSDNTVQPWFDCMFVKVPLDLRKWFYDTCNAEVTKEDIEIVQTYKNSPIVKTNYGYLVRVSHNRWYVDNSSELRYIDNSVAIEEKYNDYLKTN